MCSGPETLGAVPFERTRYGSRREERITYNPAYELACKGITVFWKAYSAEDAAPDRGR